MRLARFATRASSESKSEAYGLLKGKNIIHLPQLVNMLGQTMPSSLERFISLGLKEKDIQELIEKTTGKDLDTVTFPLKETKLLAPIVNPSKIICLGLNYKDHAQEQG